MSIDRAFASFPSLVPGNLSKVFLKAVNLQNGWKYCVVNIYYGNSIADENMTKQIYPCPTCEPNCLDINKPII